VDVSLPVSETQRWLVVEKVLRGYGSFIRKTDRPRPPYFNPVTWIGDAKRVVPPGALAGVSEAALLTAMEEWNVWQASLWAGQTDSSVDTYCKDGLWCCYGYFRHGEWMMRVFNKITTGTPYSAMSHERFDTKRKPIPRAVRDSVWAKRNAEGLVGSCYVCEEPLRFTDFECGHIIAHCLGGSATVNNLEPVCGGCNRDMGAQHLEHYRARVKAV
jgi:hypothetical protein